ncbi:RNA 3'-terminal phosphate cyclase [Planctomycetes bacterium Poly30]|uniref:RNA 3'-terminal phosphate cyclase n=1 Tax=Saltatorellus ferox TaxID=2528018 RepID=A0A518EPV2_9BACT|nr:RNA 3'-terminal phosphate cyclase [Planctomycetes bacterium Poly30]
MKPSSQQDELHIDGRQGEGGGQVLRTSLSLAAALGRPITIENVRGGRKKPGLLRQHRTALRAVRDLTEGQIEGDDLGSTSVRFLPGERCHGGNYHFAIGSAGSTMLVLQTVLPPLLLADAPSTLMLEGGTHNPAAPPFEMFAESFLPQLRSIGLEVEATLLRPGFFPAGGGQLRVEIQPAGGTQPLRLLERGKPGAASCEVVVQNLSSNVPDREWKTFQKRTYWKSSQLSVRDVQRGRGPGNVMFARQPFENVTTLHASFGMRTLSSELVGSHLAGLVRGYDASDAPVCEHLADQLMLPLALFSGGTYRCVQVSEHTRTNADVINLFLPGAVTIELESPAPEPPPSGRTGSALVRVEPRLSDHLI